MRQSRFYISLYIIIPFIITGLTILAGIISFRLTKYNLVQGADPAQPVFWCYELGEGRVFGCVPGHSAQTFDDPVFRKLLLRGIAWAAGESPLRFGERAAR